MILFWFFVVLADAYMFNGSLNRKYEWWIWSNEVNEALPCSELYNIGIKIDHEKYIFGFLNSSKISEFYIDEDLFDEAYFVFPTENIYINEKTKLDEYGEPIRFQEGASVLYLNFNKPDSLKFIPDGIYNYTDTLYSDFTFSYVDFAINLDGGDDIEQQPKTQLEIIDGTIEVKRCQSNTYFFRFDLIASNNIRIRGVYFGAYKGFE